MHNQELVTEEHRKQSLFTWMGLLKIAIIILILVLVGYLVKDFIMPKEVIKIGVSSAKPIDLNTLTEVRK